MDVGHVDNSRNGGMEIKFYEKVYLFLILTKNFDKAEQKFNSLNYFYSARNKIDDKQVFVYSLRLLYLASSNQEEEYRCLYSSLDAYSRGRTEIVRVENFVNLLSMGNYGTAIELVKSISNYHVVVVSKIEESRMIENCKLVEVFYERITLEDITNFFGIKNDAEMSNLRKYVDRLFDVG